jgi:crossover junction endodeoxyribonuclease RusA
MDEEEGQMIIQLPWPPSVNHYWRMFKHRMIISKAGREYRKEVRSTYGVLSGQAFKEHDRLDVVIEAYPPDRRRRDLDNVLKAILDGMGYQGACIYPDDSQIDRLTIIRKPPVKGGYVDVWIDSIG